MALDERLHAKIVRTFSKVIYPSVSHSRSQNVASR